MTNREDVSPSMAREAAASSHAGSGDVNPAAQTVLPTSSVLGMSVDEIQSRVSQVWSETLGEGKTVTSSLSKTAGTGKPIRRRSEVARDTGKTLREELTDNYELLDLLGKGGMGEVYAARQKSVDRVIALKRLHDRANTPEPLREKFVSEAIVTGDLEHPNIVPIYDVSQSEQGEVFYAMRQVKGRAWSDRIVDLDTEHNLDILLRVADAVAFAHSKGIIHRDLKPENIMLGAFGEVVVMDWGLAASITEEGKAQGITATVGGTPTYMAPEMALALADRIGPRSDVYLLGAILYEIVTGSPPHQGDTVQECLQHAANNELVPSDAEGELMDIALKALSTMPESRHESVQAFQAAINAYRTHAETLQLFHRAQKRLRDARESGRYDGFAEALFGLQQARELWPDLPEADAWVSAARRDYARVAYRSGDYDLALSLLDSEAADHRPLVEEIEEARREREARQRRLRLMMRAAGGMAILIFAIVSVAFFWIRAEKARAVRAEAEAKDERNRAIAARRDAEELGYLNAIALAESTVAMGGFARAAAVLERQPASLRGWEWGRLQALCHQDAFRIRVAASGRTYAVLLPDGETVAAGNEESDGITLYDIASGEARGSLPGGSSLQTLALDPTRGRLLGAYWGGTVRVWDPEAGETLFELRGHDGPVKSVVCSPDGAHYLTASLDGSARLWDAEYGVEVRRFDREGGVVEAGFSLDSQRCFSFSKDGAIRMRGIEGESSSEMEGKGCTALSWAAEGRGLIVGSTDGEVQMRPVADGLPVQLLPESGVTVESLGLGPEGKRLLVGYADGRGVLYDLESKRVVRELRGSDAPLTDLGFDPKGRFLYSADAEGTLRFWHPRSSPAGSVIEGPGGDVSSLAVSDSGERLVAASWEGGAWWASVADPAPAALSEPGSPVLDLALTPGADRVALAHADGTVRVCDVGKNASTLSFEAHEGRVFAIDWFATAWSPDGSMLLTGGEDNRVRLWRASDGSELAVLDVHSGPVHAVGFGQGSTFLTGAWESFEKRLTESNISSLRLWQWDGAAVVSPDSVPLPYEKDVLSVAFSPDGGKAVVVSAEENEVIVWDLNAKKRILRLRGHRAGILAAAWSPDGRRIFTSASDGTVKLWQATSGRDLMTLSSGDGPVYALACDSHGQSLFGGLDDGRTRVWSVLPWDESEEDRKSRRREAWLRQLGKAAPSGESTGATRGGESR